jgi:hypothetical protein
MGQVTLLDTPSNDRTAWLMFPWQMLRHPVRAAQRAAAWETIWPGFAVVIAFSLYLTLGLVRSHFAGDYPPAAEELSVWIETWGEFSMLPLPFLNIPLEQYRLFMAIITLPMVAFSWLLMASIARLLARSFGVPTSFKQYLNLFAFSFMPFWFLSALGDGLFNAIFGPYLLSGLQGQLGPLVKAFFTNYPPILYTLTFGLGGVYNGLAASGAAQGKKLCWWQAGLTGWLTFIPPVVLVALLYR